MTARSTEDPGTAGDEAEGAWADVLKQWLPEGYSVATKGRLLGADGRASPQVDLIVLKPSYPKSLKHKKYYLVDGVAAAFECKTTLRSGDLEKVLTTAKAIAGLVPKQVASAKQALMAPVVFGLLAHSHSWGGDPRTVVERLTAKIHGLAAKHAAEPRELPELLCIADLAGWRRGHCVGSRFVLWDAVVPNAAEREKHLARLQKEYAGYPQLVNRGPDLAQLWVERPHSEYQVQYFPSHIEPSTPTESWTKVRPVGAFMAALYDKLSYRDQALLTISSYFSRVHIPGSSGGLDMGCGKLPWPRTVIPDTIWNGRCELDAVYF